MSPWFLSLIIVFFFSFQSSAEITVTGIDANTYSNATGLLFGDLQTTVTTVYGGYSGPDSGCNSDTGLTCDNCEGLSPLTQTCNKKRVHDNLYLAITIQFSVTTEQLGQFIATSNVDDETGNKVLLTDHATFPPPALSGTGSTTVRIPWTALCTLANGGVASTCENTDSIPTTPVTIRIGFDSGSTDILGNDDNDEFIDTVRISMSKLPTGKGRTPFCKDGVTPEGACNFLAYPGDDSVYIENVRAECDFPSVDDAGELSSLRVYYRPLSESAEPNQAEGVTADLALSGTNEACDTNGAKIIGLAENRIGGLTNGTSYLFSIGLVDIAGNVGLVTEHTAIGETDKTDCYDASESLSDRNCHVIVPEKVIGLIDDELDCFITTATYGSPFKPKVKTFRTFRNRFLKTNMFGRLVINTYYKVSPPVARWIHNNPQSKSYVRMALWPLWFFAHLCLQWPTLILISLLSFVAFRCGIKLRKTGKF